MSAQQRSPNGTRRPPRSVRVDDDLWNAAKVKARERDETISDVIVRALTEYVEDDS
jgi:hypothetical protein